MCLLSDNVSQVICVAHVPLVLTIGVFMCESNKLTNEEKKLRFTSLPPFRRNWNYKDYDNIYHQESKLALAVSS